MTPKDIIDILEHQNSTIAELQRKLTKAENDLDEFYRTNQDGKKKEEDDLTYWRNKFSPQGTMRLVRKDGFEKLVPHHDELPPIYRVAQVPTETSILGVNPYRAPEHLTFKFERFMHAPHGSRAKIAIYYQV